MAVETDAKKETPIVTVGATKPAIRQPVEALSNAFAKSLVRSL